MFIKKCLLVLIITNVILIPLQAQSICFSIDAPGVYDLSDIEGDPTDVNDAIVCIDSSDVIVDFHNGILFQTAGNQVGGLTGIRVNCGLNNITIRNATIRSLTGKGINVLEGCSNINIENIEIVDCDEGGILFEGTVANSITNGLITNCFIDSCTGADANAAYGLRLIESENISIDNVIFQANDAGTTANGFGASLEFCRVCRMSNCQAVANGGDQLGVGIAVIQSQWTTIEDCDVLNTVARDAASTSRAAGFLLDQSTHSNLENCLSKHNTNLLAQAFGFESNAGNGNLFIQCLSQNNIGDVRAAGFAFRNNELRSSIFRSESRGNNGGASGEGLGIFLDTAQQCDISCNQLNSNTGLTGYGLRDTVTNTTNLIAGNSAFNNTSGGFNVTRTMGTFPVVTAQVGDFSAIADISKYFNIEFTVGP
ncbi:MAG: right-handed parallel beta-helix repeat-containing protein [Candidatus Babeliales bacterium]